MSDNNFKKVINEYYLHLKASGRNDITTDNYINKLTLFNEILDYKNIDKITDTKINKAIIKLQEGYPNNSPRSQAYMNQFKSVIRAFFSWCQTTGRISRDPTKTLRNSKTANSRKTQPIEIADLQRFFAAIQNSHTRLALRDEVLFGLYAYVGLRRTEALSLQIKDYYSEQSFLILKHSKAQEHNKRFIPAKFNKLLHLYTENLFSEHSYPPDYWLFPGQHTNTHLAERQANKRFTCWKKKSNLPADSTIHSLRATFATNLYKTTKDELLVSYALGHKTHYITERYITIRDKTIQEAINKSYDRMVK